MARVIYRFFLKPPLALLRVWVDYGSSGIWEIKEPKQHLAGKCWTPDQEIPAWLLDRFDYWTSWFDVHEPWNSSPGLDGELFHAYGLSLAVDLKRLLGDDYYIEFGGREIHDDRQYLQEWMRKARSKLK
jgi:hypothetical protein